MVTKYVSGFKEADRVLALLPNRVENRVLQKAVSAGAREIRNAVKANAPRSKGDRSPASVRYKKLSQNIKSQVLRIAKRKGRRGARVFTGNAFWGMFLEFGTRFISARPWFRPAVASATGNAVGKLKIVLGQGIEKEATKLARESGVKNGNR